ncbi:cAMP-activated global transcriptional regulator CRP [Thiohalophilus sp.]|uniref:cAMP-activated global transcriptional regulator CRP n=1 Tax=Thiohalophilus sp. TaxID=3028392 RepID=UPI002ACDAD6E|nr:cAMP-activated global transcriptional regulator CRP [Thiohalophilus sp.]MDZ7804292.1 cAMP-activated global transcriptional regulator CRP [Thiohalophilus sp.]
MTIVLDDDQQTEACEIDPRSMAQFLEHCTHYSLPKKSVVVRAGDPGDTLYYIIEGSVSVMLEDSGEDGHEIVLAYLNSGDFIGEMGLFYRTKNRTALVRTRTPCKLARISYDELNRLFENELRDAQPDILKAVGLQLSQRLITTNRKVSQLAFMDVTGRIARTLLDMCAHPEAMSHPAGTQIHVSRQELARIVGCSREMAGRVLKSLAEQKIIEVQGMDIVVYHER